MMNKVYYDRFQPYRQQHSACNIKCTKTCSTFFHEIVADIAHRQYLIRN